MSNHNQVVLTFHNISFFSKLPVPESVWETAHLPLLQVNNNTYFSRREKCWIKGGVGEQFSRNV